MIKTVSHATYITQEMNVIVLVRTTAASLPTQSIPDGIVGGRNGMQYSFFNKNLKCSINCYPVKIITDVSFYIHVRQSSIGFHEQLQNFFSAIGDVKLTSLKCINYL